MSDVDAAGVRASRRAAGVPGGRRLLRLGGPARPGLELPYGHTLWKAETA